MIKCQYCKSQVPESPFCLKCGYPLFYMSKKEIIHNGGTVIPETHLVHGNVETDKRRKTQITKNSFKGVEYDTESSNMFGSEELLWIRMLKHSRISDDKIKEIVNEWVLLVNKIKEVSNIF